MNVIDALVVTLGLDASDYKKNEKEITQSLKKFGDASAKQTKLIAEQGKKAAGAFSALKIEILGALAAFGMGAGFKAFIQDSMNAQAATGRWSSLLKVSAHDMQAWEGIAKGMGGSAQDAVQTMQSLASGFTEATLTGNSALNQASRRYGFKISQDPIETLNNLHQRMLESVQAGNPEQALAIGQAAGVHAQSMLFFLMQGQKEYQSMMQQMLAATGGMTEQSTEQAAKLQFQWALFEMRMETIRNKIFNKIGPVLIKLGDQLAKFLESVDWDKVIAKVGEFFEELQQIVQVLGGVKGVLIEIAAIKVFGWMASIASWVIKLRALTTALTAARAAAAAGAATTTAGPAAAAAGKGFFAKLLGGSLLLRSLWTAAWAPRPEESPEQVKARIEAQRKQFDATHPGYEQSSYLDKWKLVFGMASSPESNAAAQAAATRGMRNNNPGNIKYGAFARNMGATGQDLGGFAIFPTAQQGIAAIAANLKSYGRKGFDTPSEIAHRWSTTDQDAYTKTLAALFGGNANKQLDMTNKSVLAALTNAIISQENGRNPYLGMVNSYVGAPRGTQAKTTTNTSTVTINGPINVNAPKATNADGIAKGMRKGLQDNPLIAASVTALA